MADTAVGGIEQVNLAVKENAVPSAKEPRSFLEGHGTRMMWVALTVISLLAAATMVTYWLTQPSLTTLQGQLLPFSVEEAKAIGGSAATPEQIVAIVRGPGRPIDLKTATELVGTLRKQHSDGMKDFFQLIVLSTLVPLFTLLAGYVFGSKTTASSGAAGST